MVLWTVRYVYNFTQMPSIPQNDSIYDSGCPLKAGIKLDGSYEGNKGQGLKRGCLRWQFSLLSH